MKLKLNKDKIQVKEQQPAIATLSEESTEQGTPTEQGFSLSFTKDKTYNLDDIIFKKRRDNANCPLILKVNPNNENDTEVIKLITKLILEDYGVTGVTDENYKELVNQVPNFYTVFDLYFNRYYTFYYNEYYNKLANGSISINTVLEEIVNAHNFADELLEDASHTKAYANIFNKPRVEYEYGTSPDNYDGEPLDRLSVPHDIEGIKAEDDPEDPHDKLVLENSKGQLIEGQTPVYLKRINGESILGQGNIELLTFDDYLDFLTHCFLLTSDDQFITDADDEFFDLKLTNDN